MVRNYIPVSTKNLMNNKMVTLENIELLLNSDLKHYQKDLIQDYKNHLLGISIICDTYAALALQKYCAKKLREINREHIYQFITLSPDHIKRKIPYTDDNIKLLKEWCHKWFSDKRYAYYNYVVESGENEDDPHLHVHALILLKHKKQGKNHSRDLRNFWNKYFPSSKLVGNDYLSKNVSGQYFFDKLDYFKNDEKGSHENFCDLEIRGCFDGL